MTGNRTTIALAVSWRTGLPAWILAAVGVTIASSMATGRVADAQSRGSDGSYGRFKGDIGVFAEAGIGERFAGESFAVEAGLAYVHTIAATLVFEEALLARDWRHSLGARIEIRPLFYGRFTYNLEQGPPILDLWLDSTALTFGLHQRWGAPAAADEASQFDQTILELGLKSRFLLFPQANSPYVGLFGAARIGHLDAEPTVGAAATLTLGYQHLFVGHLVDHRDRAAPR